MMGIMEIFMSESISSSQKENSYRVLRDRVLSAGLLEKQPLYYWLTGIVILCMLGLSFYFLATLRNPLLQSLNLFLLAFAMVQCGLWGHDLAHHQIFKSPHLHTLVGIVCWNLLVGVSFGYWNYKHNRHHAHPNTINKDGDIHFPVLWLSPPLTRGINALQKKILPYQKYYFLPLLIFAYIVQMQNSITYLAGQYTKTAAVESALFLTHHLAIGYLFLHFMPFPQSLYFLIAYHAILGIYMGLIFSPGHCGMPILSPENGLDYIHEQITTTRNITPGIVNDILYGGLNYQIEHHLFPTMPRQNLKHAKKLVREFCRENAITYHETGTLRAFKEILQQLGEVSHFSLATHLISDL